MSKVKGSGLEYQAAMAQEQLRGATPSPMSEVAAGRSNPTPEARGRGHGCMGAGGPRRAIPQ